MRSLTRDELATLDLKPQDRAVLDREFERAGWVTVLGIRDSILQSVTRYQPGYFRHLCRQGRLPMRDEEQLVIGLD
jgi:hypothetical protein